ncbi:MAG: hypothetical protein Q7U51_07305 [Methanoregula sp.]|nr:hypothetical protein [Methanoregula sp.]
MNSENSENLPKNSSDYDLVIKLRESVNWGCGIFSIIFVFFAGVLVLFKRDTIIQFFSFFEISNLTIFLNNLMEKYEITVLITILLLIITAVYLYLRFFSNVRHNEFSDDMSKYLQFYETLFSTFADVSVFGILFLYLIFVKQSFWEIIIAFFVILGLAISIWKISAPYKEIIKNYSAIEMMNQQLKASHSKKVKDFCSFEEFLSNLIFYGFLSANYVWIIVALLLTIILAIFGISGEYNILTIILLELMVIRYAIFQSQIGSLPRIPVNLYLTSGEIYNRTYMIRENRDILTILTQYDTLYLVMKPHIKMVEPIIESDASQ